MNEQAGSIELTEQDASGKDEMAEIVAGLSRAQKALSPKFFYDERGSQLFERITRLPEYYPTADRARHHAGQHRCDRRVHRRAGEPDRVRQRLQPQDAAAARTPARTGGVLYPSTSRAITCWPPRRHWPRTSRPRNPAGRRGLHPAVRPAEPGDCMPARNVVYFPGSTIGNFTPADADDLLAVMRREAGEGGALLIGVDLQKDKAVLEAAYNDRAGITAEFNLNLLRRLNAEFGADFDLGAFEHLAFYNEDKGRIEMHLESRKAQTVSLAGRSFTFAAGETLHTESSHKYTLDGFRTMAAAAGFDVDTVWTDARGYFSVQYCRRR
ncbi:MAG: L-histidine N(alpha)-methyltransferase [Woeseiaceae bacterium]|nr:L-histidine N(alpha)-methyltransferase [Woeseiaceae bacterium]